MATQAPLATPIWLDEILSGLDAEQRAAATLPDGPAQIIAPAGSGKTTTLVARLGVLLARGVPPEEICVVTFNRDAALDLARRVDARLAAHVAGARGIEVRTLHALARRVVLDTGRRPSLVADRLPLIRVARRRCTPRDDPDGATIPEAGERDGIISASKIEARPVPPAGGAVTVQDLYYGRLM